ncbi:flotillin family protein [Anaerocolumna aminovalerica]|jgi:flotillin|uniref:Flotillin n=1 Tax=Anaerocolumna aminovalerica TaxID=1527 RepID=A0A1I5E073_9FIRM|nr:flotillin family protein [Anaerocolumna aminovalerica]MBU5333112.1 flotillin family protein [Anaerocolumna aminovalerica]MDU6263456.1 SPFH domain-containing protein [Anaerocolumna aminovalerica]SFO04521.1 flotillin [Anaerocolumna aminovalerica]
MEAIFIAGIAIGVILLFIILITTMWKRVPQDKALVVTGLKKRVISGGGGFVVPLLERTDKISLENMKIEVRTESAMTEQGVDIRADGVAVIKVKSDKESILNAIEQFNTGREQQTIDIIKDTSKDVLEGKLREIISKMTVEEIYKDREKFASQVQEVAAVGLATMGLELKAFTIRDISDKNGYLEALGKPRIAEVKRDAAVAEAEARRETQVKTSESERLGAEAKILADTHVAEASKEKELKVQAYREEQETAKARADLAYEIEKNKVAKEVTETAMLVELTRKEKESEIQDKEAVRREKELLATVNKQADADAYRIGKEADARKYSELKEAEAYSMAIKVKAEAEAEAIRIKGEAEAAAIRAKGMAEAETMEKKAEAYKLYNNAAVTQMIVEKLPEIAASVAEPLTKTEKIVIIDNGNGSDSQGAAKVSGYVTEIISQLPETIEAMTGFNFMEALKSKVSKEKETEDMKENNAEVVSEAEGTEVVKTEVFNEIE